MSRAEALGKLPEDEEALWAAYEFLVAHGCYHAGQIVAARLTIRPGWDMYVIYRPAF